MQRVEATKVKEIIENMRVKNEIGWGWLIGLETFVAPADMNAEQLYQGALDWLTPRVSGRMTFDLWALDIVFGLFRRMDYQPHVVDFFSPGVTTFGKTLKTLVPNKTARALIEWSSIFSQLRQPPKVFYRPFVKRERGKARIVVSASDSCFVSQVPVAKALESGYASDGLRVIYALESPERQVEIIRECQFRLAQGWYAHSIDYKSFDHLPSHDTLRLVLQAMRDKCTFDFGYDWVSAQLSGVCKVAGFPPFAHVSGVPSGWRLTSLADSIINMLVAVSVFGTNAYIVTHGDDCVVLTAQPVHVDSVMQRFTDLGAVINQYKSAFNASWFEFLKMVVDSDSIMGYPARALPSLFMRQAWQDYIRDDKEFVVSQLASIKTLLSRGAKDDPCLYQNLVREFGYTAKHWSQVLHAPMRFGLGTTGFGRLIPVFRDQRHRGFSDQPLVTNLPPLRQQALNEIYRSVGALRFTRKVFIKLVTVDTALTPLHGPYRQRPRLPTDDPDQRFLFTVWLRARRDLQAPFDPGGSRKYWLWALGDYPKTQFQSPLASKLYERIAMAYNSRTYRNIFAHHADATAAYLNDTFVGRGLVVEAFATGQVTG